MTDEHEGTGRRDRGAPPSSSPPLDPEETGPTSAEKTVAVKINTEVHDRATNAFFATQVNAHVRWKDFVEAALDAYAAELEQQYNAGKPFPQKPTDQLTRGRRVGVSPRSKHTS